MVILNPDSLTHPGTKTGGLSVRPGGELAVEAMSDSGNVLAISRPITGDTVDAPVAWQRDVSFTGGIVRLRFTIKNADVFSLRFD